MIFLAAAGGGSWLKGGKKCLQSCMRSGRKYHWKLEPYTKPNTADDDHVPESGNTPEPLTTMPSSTPVRSEQVTHEYVPQNDTIVQESTTETSHDSSPAMVTN